MCLVGSSVACDNYEADWDWMERSGNVCWGMGAGETVPCRWCRQKPMYHQSYWNAQYDEEWLDDDSSDNGA